MENLKKQATWYNPYVAITEKGNAYELENIKIYSDEGIISETGRGWFGSNNDLGDTEIDTIYLRKKVDLTKKENFIIKESKKSYRLENNYTLYIYYKNINCNFIKFDLNSYWLESVFTILDGYEIRDVLGQRHRKSDSIRYSNDLADIFKTFDTYNFASHWDEMEKNIKEIKKRHKNYIDQKEKEDQYTVKDYKDIIYDPDEAIKPIDLINNIEKTFNIKIDDPEVIL